MSVNLNVLTDLKATLQLLSKYLGFKGSFKGTWWHSIIWL